MVTGRKPKPTHLKIVEGNPGKRRLNWNEPKPAPAMPDPPEHLGAEAKAEWARVSEQLYALGLLSKLDRAILGAYCQAYGRWVEAERSLAEMARKDPVFRGLMIRTKNDNVVQNPLVGCANKAMADLWRYAAELGMTPSARSRIDAEAAGRAQANDPAEDYLAGA